MCCGVDIPILRRRTLPRTRDNEPSPAASQGVPERSPPGDIEMSTSRPRRVLRRITYRARESLEEKLLRYEVVEARLDRRLRDVRLRAELVFRRARRTGADVTLSARRASEDAMVRARLGCRSFHVAAEGATIGIGRLLRDEGTECCAALAATSETLVGRAADLHGDVRGATRGAIHGARRVAAVRGESVRLAQASALHGALDAARAMGGRAASQVRSVVRSVLVGRPRR